MAKIEDCFPGYSERGKRGTRKVGRKEVSNIGTLGDLITCVRENETLEIQNLYGGNVVRKINIEGNDVLIDAMDGNPIRLDKKTPVYYEPWLLDRGSIVFENTSDDPRVRGHDILKLATEYDPIRVRPKKK